MFNANWSYHTTLYLSDEEIESKYNYFLVDEGDLIIASSGIKVDYFDKKIAFAQKEHLPLCMNTSTIRFKSLNKGILDLRYFYYFLKTDIMKRQIEYCITGSAQLNFGPSHLCKMKAIVPPLEIQKKIVEILERAEKALEKRKEAIKLLDELVKSRFIEMFGDPVTN